MDILSLLNVYTCHYDHLCITINQWWGSGSGVFWPTGSYLYTLFFYIFLYFYILFIYFLYIFVFNAYLIYRYFFSFRIKVGSGSGFFQLSRIRGEHFRILTPAVSISPVQSTYSKSSLTEYVHVGRMNVLPLRFQVLRRDCKRSRKIWSKNIIFQVCLIED